MGSKACEEAKTTVTAHHSIGQGLAKMPHGGNSQDLFRKKIN